jgi:hypothetical protein
MQMHNDESMESNEVETPGHDFRSADAVIKSMPMWMHAVGCTDHTQISFPN